MLRTLQRAPFLALCLIMLTLLAGAMATQAHPPGAPPTSGRSQGNPTTEPLAPLGTNFTYQGRLMQNGSPANGQFDLQFALFDASADDSQVGLTLTLANVTVTYGLFTVGLDFGPGMFQGQARWLQIAVRPFGGGTYTTLSPRQPLTAAPYAMSLMPGAIITGTSSAVLSASNSGTGTGMLGTSTNGTGVYGQSNATSNGRGVYGSADCLTCVGVYGLSDGGEGVIGFTNAGPDGVVGLSNATSNSQGVRGQAGCSTCRGVFGTSTNGEGVRGFSGAGAQGHGVSGQSDCATCSGVYGSSENGRGVFGSSNNGPFGVVGISGAGTGGTGVRGESSCATCYGVYGSSDSGYGARGISFAASNGRGVWGQSNCATCSGVYGSSSNGTGVFGWSSATLYSAVYGQSDAITSGIGVDGQSDCMTCYGVRGGSSNGTGVYGFSSGGFAMNASGSTTQARYAGGWVKAMVRVGGGANITRCYNSQGSSPNSAPPCGFGVVQNAPGDYTIDFNFTVNDRYFSITPEYGAGQAVIPTVYSFPAADQVRVRTYSGGTTLIDSAFYLLVY